MYRVGRLGIAAALVYCLWRLLVLGLKRRCGMVDWKKYAVMVVKAAVAVAAGAGGGAGIAYVTAPQTPAPQCDAMRSLLKDYAAKNRDAIRAQGVEATFSCGYGTDDAKQQGA